MAKLSKRVKAFKEKVDPTRAYPLEEAVSLLKEFSTVKFNETVEVAINLGIDARKSDQAVRGATTLPYGTGSEVRVAVLTSVYHIGIGQWARVDDTLKDALSICEDLGDRHQRD